MTRLTGGLMDAITYVLIAFAGISLVTSMIMIGIITYTSVIERTKEIGILKALGARKKILPGCSMRNCYFRRCLWYSWCCDCLSRNISDQCSAL